MVGAGREDVRPGAKTTGTGAIITFLLFSSFAAGSASTSISSGASSPESALPRIPLFFGEGLEADAAELATESTLAALTLLPLRPRPVDFFAGTGADSSISLDALDTALFALLVAAFFFGGILSDVIYSHHRVDK